MGRIVKDAAEKNPTDLPKDIGTEDVPGGDDASDDDSAEEEYDWAAQITWCDSDGDSDYEMESDPDYEEERDHPNIEEDGEEEEVDDEEFNEGLALFEEWKNDFLAARKSAREEKVVPKDGSDGSSASSQP